MMNHRPTIILAALDNVYFVAAAGTIKTAGPVLSLPQKICAWLKVYALRIAAAIGPDFGSRISLTDERIIFGHTSVVVHAQNFSGQRIHLLRLLPIGGVARRDVERAVRTESQPAAGMKLGRRDAFDNDFSICQARRRLLVSDHANLLAALVVSVRKIKQVIGRKLRMKCDAHQTALASRLHVGHDKQRLWPQLSILENSHTPGSFGKKHTTVRRPHNRPNYFQVRNNSFNF